MEDDAPVAVRAQMPEAPPELVVELEPEPDGGFVFGPRVEAILDGLERIGGRAGCPPEVDRLSRFSSALVRLLVKKGFISEDELAAAFVQAERGAPKR